MRTPRSTASWRRQASARAQHTTTLMTRRTFTPQPCCTTWKNCWRTSRLMSVVSRPKTFGLKWQPCTGTSSRITTNGRGCLELPSRADRCRWKRWRKGRWRRLWESAQALLIQLVQRGRELGVMRDDLPDELLQALVIAVDVAHDRWLFAHWAEMSPTDIDVAAARIADMLRRLPGAEMNRWSRTAHSVGRLIKAVLTGAR